MAVQLLHFNDVYHVQERRSEPVGGVARFKSAIDHYRKQAPTLVVCSGDCFSPSIESTISRGKHWIEIYAAFGVDVCCLGNHDLDFGVHQLEKLIGFSGYPWLVSNLVLNEESRQPVAGCKRFWITVVDEVRIGFIGLAESEWLQTVPNLPSNFVYLPFVEEGRSLARELKSTHKCAIVIALTHMRVPNDEMLARQVDEIDLILGGHDHFYHIHRDDKEIVRVVKSGSDFAEILIEPQSECTVDNLGYADRIRSLSVERIRITSHFPPDENMQVLLNDISTMMASKLSKPLCITTVPLDARSVENRTMETNMGNLVADIVRMTYNADVSIVVGGTIRSDCVFPPGEITLGNIMDTFPYEDPIVVVNISGFQLKRVLENGLSMIPKTEGRFPQVSGIRIQYDSSRPPYQRIIFLNVSTHRLHSSGISIQGLLADSKPLKPTYEPISDDKWYTLATRGYILSGNDGYSMFKTNLVRHSPKSLDEIELVVDEEEGMMISVLLRRFFGGMAALAALVDETQWRKMQSSNSGYYKNLLRKAVHQVMSRSPVAESKLHRFIPTIDPQTEGRLQDVITMNK